MPFTRVYCPANGQYDVQIVSFFIPFCGNVAGDVKPTGHESHASSVPATANVPRAHGAHWLMLDADRGR